MLTEGRIMLIQLKQLVRIGSDPPKQFDVAVDPESIKLVADEPDCYGWQWPACRLTLDTGVELIVAASVREVVLATRGLDSVTLRLLGEDHARPAGGQT